MQEPNVSVIIPITPDGNCSISLDSLCKQNYDKKKIEVLVSIGRHRSIQRNVALQKSSGSIIFFLDNDIIIPDQNYLQHHLKLYNADPSICSVGGPSLTPDTNTLLQKAIGQILSSSFAMHTARARYMPLGKTRDSNEKELILCNQSMRAKPVKKAGGFNENLHAGNEENELVNRLIATGNRVIYEPTICIYRNQRRTLLAFIKQIAKYGQSRVEHFLIRPSSFEPVFFIPMLFFLYLLTLPIPMLLQWRPVYMLIWFAPLALYSLLSFISAVGILIRSRHPLIAILAFFLYPVHHCSYAFGNIYALFRLVFPKNRKIPDVIIKKVDLETGKWKNVL